ncbi:MAG TPA: hypothetical protein VD902_05775 [Symbiobacteriaceae bacterium]|nr:hypothetical protein [Symbiobacteriaceae bacterium]
MEFTPAVLISLGQVPAAGLARFKQESVWRPEPVCRLVRAICLGQSAPEPEGPGARAVHGWTAPEFRWLPPDGEPWGNEPALRALLRETLGLTMSAANLAAVRALPGHTVYVREHREAHGPEVCLLVDAGAAPPLSVSRLIHTVAAGLGRTLTLLFVLPDPLDEGWPAARDLVRQTVQHHGPDLLDRVWLVSREQETGELLTPDDLADALSYFCHLFAFTGWPADPGLRRYFVPEPGGEGGRLATFGVKGYRFSAPAALYRTMTDDGLSLLDDQLSVGAACEVRLPDVSVAAPEIPLPTGDEPMPEMWYAHAKLRWAPLAQAAVARAVGAAFARVPLPDSLPGRRLVELDRLLAAVREQQVSLPRPAAPPDVTPAFAALAEARRPDRWPPLVLKGIISTILSGGIAWVFFPAGSAEPAALLMATAWLLLIGVLVGLNLRDRRRALAALREAGRAWGAAYLSGLVYAETLAGLRSLFGAASAARSEALLLVERLSSARRLLSDEAAAPPLPPPRTAVSEPAPGHWSPVLAPAGGLEVEQLLQRAWAPGEPGAPVAMESPVGAEQEGPVPLLLPVRAIQPNDGVPLRTVTFATATEDPFLRARFTLTSPFAVPGSARLEEREVEA